MGTSYCVFEKMAAHDSYKALFQLLGFDLTLGSGGF